MHKLKHLQKFSILELVDASQTMVESSRELFVRVFNQQDVQGPVTEVIHKLTKRVVETRESDLSESDRLKLYGYIICEVLRLKKDLNPDNETLKKWSFVPNLGSEDQVHDVDPATVWLRNPARAKHESKTIDRWRKSLIFGEDVIRMLNGELPTANANSHNPRRFTTLADIDSFFGQAVGVVTQPKADTSKKQPSKKLSRIGVKDVLACIEGNRYAEDLLTELCEIFPGKVVEAVQSHAWSFRLVREYKINQTSGTPRPNNWIDCAYLSRLMTYFVAASKQPEFAKERDSLKRTVDLMEKLRTFVRDNIPEEVKDPRDKG